MAKRNVIKTITGTNTVDGAGVHLVRVIGYHNVRDFDPFLMLDAFDAYDPEDYIKGFPWHPHRGIETVTYLINGRIEHEDTLGNKGSITSGACQWMTAGSGILHQEMPQASKHMLGLQLWINLPQKDKMTNPKYFDIRSDMIKTVEDDTATVRIVSGSYKGTEGVKSHHIPTLMLDISVKPNEIFSIPTDKEAKLFIYIFGGSGHFGNDETNSIKHHTAALFDHNENFHVKAGAQGVRFMLFAARPLKESVAWGGPIVMNTREELDFAFEELKTGTFLKTSAFGT